MSCSIPKDLMYLPTHQWVKIDGDTGIVGITDYAQQALGGVTWIELPDEGDEAQAGSPLGSIESVKAVSDILSPVSGKIAEINTLLDDSPEVINEDPYGKGWIAKVNIQEKPVNLLSPEQYAELCKE